MEDHWPSDAAINAYYKILNCGFRPGWCAGTDGPCLRPLGSVLTYVDIKDQPLTYQRWIEGIKNGRTVVTTNGHVEFLDLKVNNDLGPGDEAVLKDRGTVNVHVKWSAIEELSGRIELVCNGKVVAVQESTAKPGEPVILDASLDFTHSGWICARRMNEKMHQTHTSAVYITVNNEPVRASVDDALFFVKWIENMIVNTSPGGIWNTFFTPTIWILQGRYKKARDIYLKIAGEAEFNKQIVRSANVFVSIIFLLNLKLVYQNRQFTVSASYCPSYLIISFIGRFLFRILSIPGN